MPLDLPPEFGYVILVIGLTWFVNFYLVFLVVGARKKYGIKYPALYATGDDKAAVLFNSAQRAHQNTLENWAPFQILMILNGLLFPTVSAVCGILWCIGRVVYGWGYSRGGPEGRTAGGIITHLGDLPLILLTFYTGASFAGLV